jgi:hypothetical protein
MTDPIVKTEPLALYRLLSGKAHGTIRRDDATSGGIAGGWTASSTYVLPIASHNSKGPRSQPNPHRIARSTSSIE